MLFATFLLLFLGEPDSSLLVGEWQNSQNPKMYLVINDSTVTVINPGYGEMTNKYERKTENGKTFIYFTDSAVPKKLSIKKLDKNILITRSIIKSLNGEWKRVDY